jgi:hypothetical protein
MVQIPDLDPLHLRRSQPQPLRQLRESASSLRFHLLEAPVHALLDDDLVGHDVPGQGVCSEQEDVGIVDELGVGHGAAVVAGLEPVDDVKDDL